MKRKSGITLQTDIIILVFAACIGIVGCAAITEWAGISPLYAGMGMVFAYILFLALFLGKNAGKQTVETTPESETVASGDLQTVVAAFDLPAAICNEIGTIVWYNDAFAHALGWDTPMSDVLFDDVCRSAERVRNERAAGGYGTRRAPEVLFVADQQDVYFLGAGIYRMEHFTMPSARGKNILLFHDITELNEYIRRFSDGQTAVAYITIDNIEDLLQYIQDSFRSAAAEVELTLKNWAKSMNGVIRSYERDKYIMFFDRRHMEECRANAFAILDEVRKTRVGDSIPVTVSMGMCCARGTLYEREQQAQAALDMALQRGGDQVVCKTDDGNEYYGGKTKALYKRANVRARTVGYELIQLLGRASNVLIMGHSHGDYDSFGASIGIARLAMSYVSDVRIVCNRNDFNLAPCFEKIAECHDFDELVVDPSEASALVKPKTLLVIVDVNNIPNSACPRLFDMVQTTVIIDHHTQTAAFSREPEIAYIEPAASSASEMVAEILEQHLAAKQLLPQEAELLYSGILLDTKQFTKNTGTRTFGAAFFLRAEGANPSGANEFFKNDIDDLTKQAQFMTNVQIYKEHLAIAVCEGDTDTSYRVVAAKAADRLLTARGITASFALVFINGKIHISARSDGTVNVAKILEEIHGGGRYDAAGALLEDTEGQSTVELLKKAIDRCMD